MVITGENVADFVVGKMGKGLGDEGLELLAGKGVTEFEGGLVGEVVYDLGVGSALATELAILIICGLVVLLGNMVQEEVTKVDIVAFLPVGYVGDTSKVNKGFTSKYFFPKGS